MDNELLKNEDKKSEEMVITSEQKSKTSVSKELIKDAVIEAQKDLNNFQINVTQNTTQIQLPSNGLMNPNITHITLRRMTTKEIKTLHTSKDPNYLTNLILGCITEPTNITVNDLHPNDIIYLTFVLRYISTPKQLVQKVVCPSCRKLFDSTVDIQKLDVTYWNGTSNEFTFKLPECGDILTFKILSEGELINADKIAARKIKQFSLSDEDAEWYQLISKVGYQITAKNEIEFDEFKDKIDYLEGLSGYDFESYQQAYLDIINSFGLDMKYITECPKCKDDVEVQAYIAPDFFRLV